MSTTTPDAALRDVAITEPGIYNIPADVYHADPTPTGSLSSTGARKLLPPDCPATFRWWTDNGEDHNPVFDYGTAAHKLVLGSGPTIRTVDANNWRGKAARTQRIEAYELGEVPMLKHQVGEVEAMAAAIRRHPLASALLDPTFGAPEQSLFWVDPELGVWRRARLDWLPHHQRRSRLIIPDYKTTVSAAPAACAKSMVTYGYDQQGAWYLDAAQALGVADGDATVVFIFQEKTPPYLINVAEPSDDAFMWARRRNRKALDVYRACQAAGEWPGYSDDVTPMELPPWRSRELEDQYWLGAYHVEDTP